MPLTRLRSTKTITRKRLVQYFFRGSGTLVVDTNRILVALFYLENRVNYKILRIKGDFGISTDPVDMLLTFGMGLTEESLTAGDISPLIWTKQMTYLLIGAGTGTIKGMEQEDVELNEEFFFEQNNPARKVAIWAAANTTPTVRAVGFVDVEETYQLRKFKDDLSEWGGYEYEEVSLFMGESS